MGRTFKITRWVGLVGMVLWLAASGPLAAAEKGKSPAKITYDDHVMPILREKCFACHNQDRKSGGLRLHTFTNLMAGGASGAIVKPGDPEESSLFKSVSHQQEPFMPPKSPMLPKETLETIRSWIKGGALENSGSKVQIVNKPKFDISLSAVSKGKPQGPPPMPGKLNLNPVVHTSRANAVTALASSPWAPLVAVAGLKQVLLYQSDTLELLGVLPFPEGVPQVLKFSRNGSLLLAGGGRGGKSGKVVVWSVATGERIFAVGDEMDAVLAADISADQTQIALGGPSKVVRVYSTKDGKLLYELKKHTDWIYALEFSPDGVLLATGDRAGNLFVWEAFTGREYFTLKGPTAAITDVCWRADANVLANSSEDGTVRWWEMENGTMIKTWAAHGGGVENLRYSRDGRLVTCGRDKVVKVWDAGGNAQRTFEAFPDVALRATFSHDGNRIVGGDWTGQIRVWNAADGKVVGNLLMNPPSAAEQFAVASREFATKQADFDRLARTSAVADGAARKAAEELAAAQQDAAGKIAAGKIVADALAHVKDPLTRAETALAEAQNELAAKEALARALLEASAKIKDAADKAKTNKHFASAAARSQAVAAQFQAEWTAAQKVATERQQTAQSVREQWAQAQTASAFTSAAADAALKVVQARAAVARQTSEQAAKEKAALDAANAARVAAHAVVEKWKAVVTVSKHVKK